jgi:hypothetical protein
MLTENDKNQIVTLINSEIPRLGSQKKLSIKCGVSDATLSNMRAGIRNISLWKSIREELWLKVGNIVGYSGNSDTWHLAETTNYRLIYQTLDDARNASMFMAISHKAGSGKTATINAHRQADKLGTVYTLQCEEWSRRNFLLNLCRILGISEGRGYEGVNILSDKVIRFFVEIQKRKPLMVFDEADKLKPSALRWLIHFYNKLEDKVGCVISGTDNLEKEIKRGVKYNLKGYDEIDSRFGRSFIKLTGATFGDVKAICTINGISDELIQREIFQTAGPVNLVFRGKTITVVEDLRRVKRIIVRERLKKEVA